MLEKELGELELAGDRQALWLEIVFELQAIRGEVELRVEELFPSDFFPGLSGVGSKESVSSGIDHVLATVDAFAGSEGREELVVLDLIHILLSLIHI